MKKLFIYIFTTLFLTKLALADTDFINLQQFSLVDQNNKEFTNKSFLGKWSVVYFGYTFCPEICPAALNNISIAIDNLPADKKDKIQFLFISVDPKRDVQTHIKEYMANFNERIIGITGTEAEIEKIKANFKVYVSKTQLSDDPMDYSVDHTSIVYILTPEGKFASYVSYNAPGEEIAKTINSVVR